MNAKIKDCIRDFTICVERFILNTSTSFVSILRMSLLSTISTAKNAKRYRSFKNHTQCTILANGPSLKEALDNNEVYLENVDIFCVNMFCKSEYFNKIKPRFYFLVDGAMFTEPKTERIKNIHRDLITSLNLVDWQMFLCISSSSVNGGVLKEINNPNIRIIRWNTTTFEGYRWLKHWIFRIGMGMPRCQTVTNFALMTAIQMKYKQVFLYGADHSWTKDLFVNDNNVVCYGDRHVYKTNIEIIKKEGSLARLLHSFANMFQTHIEINEYALEESCEIINCTKGSFVDAYKRK